MKLAYTSWVGDFATLFPSADLVSIDPLPVGTFTATDSSGSLAIANAATVSAADAGIPAINLDFGRTPTGDVQITLAIPANVQFASAGVLSAPLTYAAPKNFGPKEFYGGWSWGNSMALALNTGKELVTAAGLSISAATLTDDSGSLTITGIQVLSSTDGGVPYVEIDYDREPVGQIVATLNTPSLITFAGGGHPSSPLTFNVWTWTDP